VDIVRPGFQSVVFKWLFLKNYFFVYFLLL
jgi:hypothetical protein